MSEHDNNPYQSGGQSDPWKDAPEQAGKKPGAEEKPVAEQQGKSEAWQQDLINRLTFASINEQRRSRRWGIFFKFLLFIYLFFIIFYLPGDWGGAEIKRGNHTAVIEMSGVIAASTEASADNVVTGLRNAFENERTAGVILRINSPGGSPVQSGYIYDEITRLKGLKPNIPVYAVVVDICASGGYYVASAADEIYADKASMVGSIGVLMNGFGFTGAMDKLGIERRLMTAGENKGFLDPFSPMKEKEVEHVQGLLGNIHQQFIEAVQQGRGDRLAEDADIFSGLVWSGEQAVDLGLVDGLGSTSYVARELIGVEKIVDFTPRPDYWQRFADRIGVSMGQFLSSQMEMKLQ